MSKMTHSLRASRTSIGLSIKKNPIENGLKLREKNPYNWFRDKDQKTALFEHDLRRYLDLWYSFDPGKYTRVFDHAEHESDIEISFQNQSEWVLHRFLWSNCHALLKANTTSAGRLRRPADKTNDANVLVRSGYKKKVKIPFLQDMADSNCFQCLSDYWQRVPKGSCLCILLLQLCSHSSWCI